MKASTKIPSIKNQEFKRVFWNLNRQRIRPAEISSLPEHFGLHRIEVTWDECNNNNDNESLYRAPPTCAPGASQNNKRFKLPALKLKRSTLTVFRIMARQSQKTKRSTSQLFETYAFTRDLQKVSQSNFQAETGSECQRLRAALRKLLSPAWCRSLGPLVKSLAEPDRSVLV